MLLASLKTQQNMWFSFIFLSQIGAWESLMEQKTTSVVILTLV